MKYTGFKVDARRIIKRFQINEKEQEYYNFLDREKCYYKGIYNDRYWYVIKDGKEYQVLRLLVENQSF